MAQQSPAEQRVEQTRSQQRVLMAANPNYFGNFPTSGFKPVKALSSVTTYEDLTSVGYNQHTKRLYATFDIKHSTGYAGDLCDDGSDEFVRFFVDHGSGWTDVGLVATDVHDIPAGQDCGSSDHHPLSYSVELPYAPTRRWCVTPQLPRVRAILSWNVEPPAGNPTWVPVYGAVRDCTIQIDKSWLLTDFVDVLTSTVKLPPGLLESLPPVLPPLADEPVIPDLPEPPFPAVDPSLQTAKPALTLEQRIASYTDRRGDGPGRLTVEPSRFAFAEVTSLQTSAAISVTGAKQLSSALAPFDIDITKLVAVVEDTTGNIDYEELEDVGLDQRRSKLVATYRVKKQSGFSGGLCTSGSLEHVSFWADWADTCDWEYLGTVSLRAYDLTTLPDGGLCYSAALPVDVEEFQRRCSDPRVARVRAVLSWSTPPSSTDPDDVPTWGNRLDAHVLVPRLEGEPGQLSVVGGIHTRDISDVTGMASASAKFVDTGTTVYSPSGQDVPFGGLIVVRGPAITGKRYRLQVIDSSSASQTLTEKIWVTPTVGASQYHTGSVDGWFDYLSHQDNFAGILGYYRSSGEDTVTIQLEVEGEGVVDTQRVQLDNTWPHVAVSITAPVGDCGLITPGVTLQGLVEATDVHMGAWEVEIDGGPAGFGPVTVLSGNADTAVGGTPWTFDTTGLVQCGYVVRVVARDRAIVGSISTQHSRSTDVGFCVLEG